MAGERHKTFDKKQLQMMTSIGFLSDPPPGTGSAMWQSIGKVEVVPC
jgi:hypothetical protein